jgi:hypothetical protein
LPVRPSYTQSWVHQPFEPSSNAALKGLELSRRFYFEAARPILERRFPDFVHAAALIGHGSEVLGYDDERSRDHQWGPRVLLFVGELERAEEVRRALAHELPTEVGGFSTHFGPTEEEGTVALTEIESGPVDHRVEILVLKEYLRAEVGVDPLEAFTSIDWLVTPSQRLLELTAGEVFTDPIGDLTKVRKLLAYYPHDVWLVVMAGHWRRIAQLEHFLGRTGSRDDEVGSRLIAASLVHDLMRLALLQERRYPPYWKWLGTAYAELRRPEAATLTAAVAAAGWEAREDALVEAYEAVARRHNDLRVTPDVDPTVRPFWGRPFRVLFADRFVEALHASISDASLKAIEHRAGAMDAVSDNVDVRSDPTLFRKLSGLYDRA